MAVSISGSGAITGMVSADSSDLSTALAAKANYPAGGTDGQALIKSGTTTAWGSAGAMVFIAGASPSAASSVSVNNCFTSSYANYFLVFTLVGSTGTNLRFRYRASGSDNSDSNHAYQNFEVSNTSVGGARSTGQSSYLLGNVRVDNPPAVFTIYLANPQAAASKSYKSDCFDPSAGGQIVMNYGSKDVTTQFDGFTIYPASGTITGSVRVYALQNS